MRSFFSISDWSGNQPNTLNTTVVMTTNVHAAPNEDSLIDYFNDQLSNRLIELGVSDTILDLFDIANFKIIWIFKLDDDQILTFLFNSYNIDACQTIADILSSFF